MDAPNLPLDLSLPARLAVLISGTGRSLQHLHDRIEQGEVPAEIRLVISSRGDAPGLARARNFGLPCCVVRRRDHATAESFREAVFSKIRAAACDLVLLMGYLQLLPIPPDYEGRVLNIHPALLPDFGGKGMYGDRVHAAVLASGAAESGCTVHFCDNEYDHGPILVQRRCPVLPGDTVEDLAHRVFEEEKKAWLEALRLVLPGAASAPPRSDRSESR